MRGEEMNEEKLRKIIRGELDRVMGITPEFKKIVDEWAGKKRKWLCPHEWCEICGRVSDTHYHYPCPKCSPRG